MVSENVSSLARHAVHPRGQEGGGGLPSMLTLRVIHIDPSNVDICVRVEGVIRESRADLGTFADVRVAHPGNVLGGISGDRGDGSPV